MSLDPDIRVTVTAAPRVNAAVKPAKHISVSVAPAEIHVVGTAALGPRGPAGPPGDPGPTGDQGPPGDPGNDGRTPDFAGDWFPTVEYWPSAIVRYQNATYGSRGFPPMGTAPTTGGADDPWWQLVAEDGEGGSGGSINMPADWDYGTWANLTSNGVLVDADHPYEVKIAVRATIAELSGSTAEVFLLVAADSNKSWVAADLLRRQRAGGPGSGVGNWVFDDIMTAVVPAGGYIMVSISLAASGASIGPGVYNWASRRRLD